METTQELYTEKDYKFFYGQIQGQEELGGFKEPIANYSIKIRDILLEKGIDHRAQYIRQVLWTPTVNDDIWNATVEMLIQEKEKRVIAKKKKEELLQN